MCTNGDQQSPITLAFPSQIPKYFKSADTKNDPLKAAKMINSMSRDSFQIKADMSNPDRAIEFEFSQKIHKNGLICEKYVCHFDAAEHKIHDGDEVFAECQLICFKNAYDNYDDALFSSSKGAIQIFSVRYELGTPTQDNKKSTNKLIKAMSTGRDGEFNFPKISEEADSYWRYDGSVTTPTCEEVVTWTIFVNTVSVDSRQIEKIRSLISGNDVEGIKTNRELQKINRREIQCVYICGNHERSLKSTTIRNFRVIFD